MEREKVTATIITLDEEDNIGDCLRSVKWADEIVVVDCGSSDRTVEIARQYTDKVYHNPWPGHKEQKNFAVDKSSNLWIFSIDADERATEELASFVLAELRAPQFDGYRFPRKNHFLGQWLKHGGWYPDHVLRLFRKDRGSFGGTNPHDKVILGEGKVATTSVSLLHFTYRNFSQYESKIHSYSSIMAAAAFVPGRSSRWIPLLTPIKAVAKFLEVYVVKRGFLDGYLGLVVAMASACSAFWKYAKLWELQRSDSLLPGKDRPAP